MSTEDQMSLLHQTWSELVLLDHIYRQVREVVLGWDCSGISYILEKFPEHILKKFGHNFFNEMAIIINGVQ